MADLVGQILLKRYRIDEFLGRGGMAEVYKAWDAKRSVYVALKVLNEDLAEDYVFLRPFAREARALGLLQHPHIVRFFGFEESQDLAFLVMEYIDGVTLRRQLKVLGRPLTLPEALAVLQPVCGALHYTHQTGIFHCDVKMANIFIERGGRVVLADFGIARLSESATVTFSTPGTPAYMAPEQCRGEELDARTDIYSLGVTTYEMLTLDRPFKGDSEGTTGSRGERVRWEQMNVPPPRLASVNPDISPVAEAAILRALEKEPDRRWQQALHFYQELSADGKVQPAANLTWGDTAMPVLPPLAPAVDQAPKPLEEAKRPSKAILPWLVGGAGAVLGSIALALLLVVALLVWPGRGAENEAATPVAQLTPDTPVPPTQERPPTKKLPPTQTPTPLPATSTPVPTPTPTIAAYMDEFNTLDDNIWASWAKAGIALYTSNGALHAERRSTSAPTWDSAGIRLRQRLNFTGVGTAVEWRSTIHADAEWTLTYGRVRHVEADRYLVFDCSTGGGLGEEFNCAIKLRQLASGDVLWNHSLDSPLTTGTWYTFKMVNPEPQRVDFYVDGTPVVSKTFSAHEWNGIDWVEAEWYAIGWPATGPHSSGGHPNVIHTSLNYFSYED